MKSLQDFFSSKKNSHSMMRLMIFILSLPIIFHIIKATIIGNTIDWSGLSIYVGVLLGGKVGQKFAETNKNKDDEQN
jgi:hypothetical protein